MNGFKPLGDLKGWHIYGCFAFACIGVICTTCAVVYGIIWLINHVTITP